MQIIMGVRDKNKSELGSFKYIIIMDWKKDTYLKHIEAADFDKLILKYTCI